MSKPFKISACIFLALLSSNTFAALVGRLEVTPGSGLYQAYYDDQLDVTWAANANINGIKTYNEQLIWVNSLSIGGITGWRLPTIDANNDHNVVDCTQATQQSCKDNEFGHLFYYGAGNTPAAGITYDNQGVFSNIMPFRYWTSTLPPPAFWSYTFNMQLGYLLVPPTAAHTSFAWAVHSGDVAAVPIPSTLLLLSSGLFGLVCLPRKKAS